MSDFFGDASNTQMSPAALESMLKKLNQSEATLTQAHEAVLGPLQDLGKQAEAVSSNYRSNVSNLMSEGESINADLVQALSVPRKIGKLFSLFGDQTYNPEYQAARAQAVGQKFSNEKAKYDANVNVINVKKDVLMTELSAKEQLTTLIRQNVGTMISGMNALREQKRATQEDNVFALTNSFGSKELDAFYKQAQKTGSTIVGGKPYTAAEIGAAKDKRMQGDLSLNQMAETLKNSIYTNDENSRKAVLNATNSWVGGMSWNEIQAQLAKPEVRIPTADGKGLAGVLSHEAFLDAVTQKMRTDKDARGYLQSMEKSATETLGTLSSITSRIGLVNSLPNFDPIIRQELNTAATSIFQMQAIAEQAQKKMEFIGMDTFNDRTKQALAPKMFSPVELAMRTGGFNEEIKAKTVEMNKMLDEKTKAYFEAQPAIAKQVFQERASNGGKVVNKETALKDMSTQIASPTVYGGERQNLNAAMFASLQKIFPQQFMNYHTGKESAEGPSLDLNSLMSAGANFQNDPRFVFMKTDETFAKYGGFRGAVIATDIGGILRQAVHLYAKEMKQPGFEALVDDNGNWQPAFTNLYNTLGPLGAINAAIGSMDAKNIAEGQYNVNDAVLKKFYSFALQQYQKGVIRPNIDNSNIDADTNLLVYGNDENRTFQNILGEQLRDIGTPLRQQMFVHQQKIGPVQEATMPSQTGKLGNQAQPPGRQRIDQTGFQSPPGAPKKTGIPAIDDNFIYDGFK